jgi:hypothetical protein
MCVCNPDRSRFGINRKPAQTPSGVIELVGDDPRSLRRSGG